MKEPRILLVEDMKGIRDEVRDILTFEGMQVIVAENGQEGVDKAKEQLPDLILCDIMMPKKNGFEVFDEVKKNNILKHIPFIFMTAKVTYEDLAKGMKLGADNYISKPINIDFLIKSIKNHLYKKKTLD